MTPTRLISSRETVDASFYGANRGRVGMAGTEWDEDARATVEGCVFVPESSGGQMKPSRNVTPCDGVLYASPGDWGIQAGDKARLRFYKGGAFEREETYLVQGEPQVRTSCFEGLDHVRVELAKWES